MLPTTNQYENRFTQWSKIAVNKPESPHYLYMEPIMLILNFLAY